jgi:hypothetical protein
MVQNYAFAGILPKSKYADQEKRQRFGAAQWHISHSVEPIGGRRFAAEALHVTPRNDLGSAQQRRSIIAACGTPATLR